MPCLAISSLRSYNTDDMYLTTHASVGILISQSIDRPLYVFLLSVLSHFLLDFIPHGDEHMGEWVRRRKKNAFYFAILDVGLLALMVTFLYSTSSLPQMALISAGIIGAVLPDLLSNVFPVIHHYTNWFFLVRYIHRTIDRLQFKHLWRLHDWFHTLSHNTTNRELTFTQGIAMQIAITVIAVVVAVQLYNQ